MKKGTKIAIVVSICLPVMLAVAAASQNSRRALAQPEPPGRLNVALTATDYALKGRPVMISAINDGKIINQYEVLFIDMGGRAVTSTILDRLPPGACDVRVEGEGIITEVKRGAQVYSGRDGYLQFVIRPGKGAHMVEYATGGLSREETAARIEKLEAAVAQLQKAVQSK
ncbi:MAG: hypothetical protein MOB07_16875 [Acidobacteria bacterium]|nr:hypothetical protein [Acidobacteriota bacterium]